MGGDGAVCKLLRKAQSVERGGRRAAAAARRRRASARTYDTYVVAATSSLLVLGIAILWAWGAVVALAGRSSVTLDATLGADEAEGAIGI